jgi:iron complex outermembrane receptor protein
MVFVIRSLALTAALLVAGPASAGQRPPLNLAEMSIEELLTVNVTSAGKKEQLIADTAAALYVITADDIRRNNVSTITEVLRQVPGILVARQATGEWSISIRGFNDNHANKLLVLMDGRTLYSPLYTGVEWDVHDTMIEDIERIEVIRGPGAALWGANAVNGVINIITKHAADTRGGLVTFQGGQFERTALTARYGGSISPKVQYRLFGKYFNRPSLEDGAGDTPYGGWDSVRSGGRLDWSPNPVDHVTMSGDWSLSNLREIDDEITSASPPFESVVEEHDRTRTAFLLTQWNRKRSNGSEFDVRFFYDHNRQSDALGHDKIQTIETADVEFNYHLPIDERHDLVWGGGIRQVRDSIKPDFNSFFVPDSYRARTYNAFVQHEVTLKDEAIRLTTGSKLERNSFSGFEVQPTFRALWAPTKRQSVWVAVSRAVRVPSREERDGFEVDSIGETQDGAIAYALLVGSPDFKPEQLIAYEAGYRIVTARRLSIDVASFYNAYDDLQTIETGETVATLSPVAGRMTPLVRANNAYGRVMGAEVTAFWTVSPGIQLSGNYTRLQPRLDARPESNDEDAEAFEDTNARNLVYVRGYADLPYAVDFAGELRYVSAITGEDVPAYVDGNIHLSRAIRAGVRLKLTVENLMHRRHAEWNEGELVQSRALRASLTWQF